MKQLLIFLIISADFLITYLICQFLINQFLLIRMHNQRPAIVFHQLGNLRVIRNIPFRLIKKQHIFHPIPYIVFGKQDTIIF